MDSAAFPFLSRLHDRLAGRETAPADALAAVALLTATADPSRAERLRPRAGEPAVLVERLAVWALHLVDADTILEAASILSHNGRAHRTPETTDTHGLPAESRPAADVHLVAC